MNYNRIYREIISSSLNRVVNGYTEKHHVIPKSMGGSDAKSNIAVLTAREHFICHWLLVKIHRNREMIFAWNCMCRNRGGERYTSKSFSYARAAWAKQISILNTGVKFSPERLINLSKSHIGQVSWNKGIKTGEMVHYRRIRDKYYKNPINCKFCSRPLDFKVRNTNTYCSNKCAHSDPDNPTRKASPRRVKNSGSFKKGDKPSGEVSIKISKALTGYKRPRGTCQHCGKEGAISLLKRWHFDNCKELVK